MKHLCRPCSKKEDPVVTLAAQNGPSFWAQWHFISVSALVQRTQKNKNKSFVVDLNDQGLCSRSECLCNDLSPSMATGQSKPLGVWWFSVPTLVPSLWLQNQIGATFHNWFQWLFLWPGWAPRGSFPEDSIPMWGKDGAHCFASGKLGSWCQLLCLPQEDRAKNLSVQGSSVFKKAPAVVGPPGLFPLYSCCFGTVLVPDASGQCSHRSLWITVPSKQLFFKKIFLESIYFP